MSTADEIRARVADGHRALRRLTLALAGLAAAATAVFAGAAATASTHSTGTDDDGAATASVDSGLSAVPDVSSSDDFSSGAEAPSASTGGVVAVSGGS